MSDFPHSALDEYKTQASLLLKQLRSDDTQKALESAVRFQQLPHLANKSAIEIVKSEQIKLKHALTVIAQEHNHESWASFKQKLERKAKLKAHKQANPYHTDLYPRRCAGYVLEWHSDYEIASTELGRIGGYLLPYKKQFFICEAPYIEELGLDPDDPDWALINWNWVRPADQDAWQRLNEKLQVASSKLF
ncbi:MAG: hypothetical protein Phog2KO_38150 [Phototrophicaceae bacterium]